MSITFGTKLAVLVDVRKSIEENGWGPDRLIHWHLERVEKRRGAYHAGSAAMECLRDYLKTTVTYFEDRVAKGPKDVLAVIDAVVAKERKADIKTHKKKQAGNGTVQTRKAKAVKRCTSQG